ncbi:Pre-mRNA-splicing factor cwc24 [Cladophialophora carrionii]|uniref:Pre-mRNA-splicing factor CWC24 n=1 Tax=Cladophialophora carrionii TaxID=86049 RepID=A0A1C1CPX8_9EURO|nr:Pre-mRNA-splicing factor cwc24 [Cladophialophora carrionii]
MEDPQAASAPAFSFKKRNPKSKSTIRKRPATPPPDASSHLDSDSDSGFSSFEDSDGQRQVKRRRKNAGTVAASSAKNVKPRHPSAAEPASAASAAVVARTNKEDATKTSNWFDEEDQRMTETKASEKANAASTTDGTYKGVANYQSFIQKSSDRPPAPASKQVGPVKSSTNVRTITVTDFAPDVCKDYKQTGFCGFGDNCKYLHAREDYKQGWQLDRDWEINTKGKTPGAKTVASANRNGPAAAVAEDDEDEKLLERIPFACIICKDSYKNPIVTKCGHYFCEACALKRYRKDPSCAACGAGTGGVFNVAKKLNRLLDKKRERERLKKEKASEAGEHS